MSSAATLRRFGKGTAAVATAAVVMTAFGPAAFADWRDGAANITAAQSGNLTVADDAVAGTVGVVDTNKTVADNQGAKLVQAGKNDQAVGSVRFTIPNRFAAGDVIELYLLDRSAQETSDGNTNLDADHLVGFSGVPTVTAVAQNDDTLIDANTDDPADSNPENPAGDPNPWVAENSPAVAGDIDDVAPGTAPKFATTLDKDVHGVGSNVIRMRIDGVSSTGDPLAKWVVTLSNLKVDLGPKVTPGDLRVVPFARSAVGGSLVDADWFKDGGAPAEAGNTYANLATRNINTYTVPAQVAPISVATELPNLIADNNPQSVGKVTITEVAPNSMGNGPYVLRVAGGSIATEKASDVTFTVTNGGAAEAVSAVSYLGANGLNYATLTDAAGAGTTVVGVNFTLAGADATKTSTFTASGMLLQSATPGTLQFSVTGGTVSGAVDTWLADPGESTVAGVPVATAFADATGDINQQDILSTAGQLLGTGLVTSATQRIGGNNRYETAGKVALQWGASAEVILASGENYPDALSASYLSQKLNGGTGGPILLTMKGSLPADTVERLRDLDVKKVYIIGGTSAVSSAVEDKLQTLYTYSGGGKSVTDAKLQTVRLGGASRYETNQYVNMYGAAMGTNTIGRTVPAYPGASKYTAILARGDNYPDALVAGVLTAGQNGAGGNNALPLLLTTPTDLHAAAKAQIANLDVGHLIVVGDTGAVSTAAEDTAKTNYGVTTTRVAGKDRYETAVRLTDFAMKEDAASSTNTSPGLGFITYGPDGEALPLNPAVAFLANGLKFPDALVAAPWIGKNNDALLLVNTNILTDPTAKWLSDHSNKVGRAVGLGLGEVVSSKVLVDANALASKS